MSSNAPERITTVLQRPSGADAVYETVSVSSGSNSPAGTETVSPEPVGGPLEPAGTSGPQPASKSTVRSPPSVPEAYRNSPTTRNGQLAQRIRPPSRVSPPAIPSDPQTLSIWARDMVMEKNSRPPSSRARKLSSAPSHSARAPRAPIAVAVRSTRQSTRDASGDRSKTSPSADAVIRTSTPPDGPAASSPQPDAAAASPSARTGSR